jgi:hypothetical protein
MCPPAANEQAVFSVQTPSSRCNPAWLDSSRSDQVGARNSGPAQYRAALSLRQRLGKHPLQVFSYHGKRITQVSAKAWYAALKEAGNEDFGWHVLRLT